MVVLSFHNIFEWVFETLSSQVKIQLQLREEDGVLRSSLHTLSNGSQVLLTSQIYKRYGHFLIAKQIRFYEQAL